MHFCTEWIYSERVLIRSQEFLNDFNASIQELTDPTDEIPKSHCDESNTLTLGPEPFKLCQTLRENDATKRSEVGRATVTAKQ